MYSKYIMNIVKNIKNVMNVMNGIFINKKMIFLILALLFAVISIPFVGNNMETFTNLTPGVYPLSTEVPLLNEYPLKNMNALSNNTAEDNSSYYPIFDSSYKQITNNVKYWASPNNGKCTPPDFCGALYKNKQINTPKTPAPIPFSSPDIRVNFYDSHKLLCNNEN